MTRLSTDVKVLRDLAASYAEIAAQPAQESKRELWASHNSLKPTRPPVLCTYGMWNVWCREVFADERMECEDDFLRTYERGFRMQLLQNAVGDDSVLEPWVTVPAVKDLDWGRLWGFEHSWIPTEQPGGAMRIDPPIRDWSDLDKLQVPHHRIDEEATSAKVQKLGDAIGDIIEINVDRGPVCQGFMSDISTDLAMLRGLDQLMVDMYDSPQQLHQLLAFMRDGTLTNQAEAEQAGDWSLTSQQNQQACYCEGLEAPAANSGPRKRNELWAFCAAQEFTLISPRMHEEFMLQYQVPIYEKFALVAYGCCEDLTAKIDMLRQMPNLRQIGVAPRADVAKCAEQIGTDYVLSWRPNPTDMVCCGFDEGRIRRVIRAGLEAARGCRVHIHLKDIECVEGDLSRLSRWVQLVRQETERF